MNLDQQLPDLLRRTVATIDPPPAQQLVDGGLERGRALRRRRQLLVGAGSALGTAAVTGVAVLAAGHLGNHGSAPAASSPTVSRPPAHVRTTTPPPPHRNSQTSLP